MLLVHVFGLPKGFWNNRQHPETRRFFLVAGAGVSGSSPLVGSLYFLQNL
jgi:hypothetical protein